MRETHLPARTRSLASSNASPTYTPHLFSHALLQLLPTLSSSTLALRTSCAATLAACADLIGAVNHGRWARGAAHRANVAAKERALGEKVEMLKGELRRYREEGRLEIVEPFVPMLEKYMSMCDAAQQQLAPSSSSSASASASSIQPTNISNTTTLA